MAGFAVSQGRAYTLGHSLALRVGAGVQTRAAPTSYALSTSIDACIEGAECKNPAPRSLPRFPGTPLLGFSVNSSRLSPAARYNLSDYLMILGAADGAG